MNDLLQLYPGADLWLVGHSLGGAIALLDAIYLPLWLPSGTTFKTVGYGLPRVSSLLLFVHSLTDERLLGWEPRLGRLPGCKHRCHTHQQ